MTLPALALLALLAQDLPHRTAPTFVLPEGGVQVPLLDWGGRPVVEVRSGEERLRLIVDTGTSAVLVLGSGAPEVEELRLGEARLLVPHATRLEFPLGRPGAPEERIDGILGLPAFGELLLVLDLDQRRLELSHGTLAEDAEGVVPYRADDGLGGVPTLSLLAGGVAIEAHFDTGSPELLLVPSELAERLPLAAEPRKVGLARTPMGDAEIREAPLEGPIEIGPLRIEPVQLRIADLPQIAGRNLGNVGTRLFGRSRLSLDLGRKRLRIEPAKASEADDGS